jgi:hypothetical protein
MAVKKNHKAILNKLKKQVRILERKEAAAKNKLAAALAKMRKLTRSYKSKLTAKMRLMKNKIAEAEASTYAKALIHLERQMLKGLKMKAKALTSALAKIEKKSVAKLAKGRPNKGRSKKSKKIARKAGKA